MLSPQFPNLIQHGISDNPSVPKEPSTFDYSSHNWRKGVAQGWLPDFHKLISLYSVFYHSKP